MLASKVTLDEDIKFTGSYTLGNLKTDAAIDITVKAGTSLLDLIKLIANGNGTTPTAKMPDIT